MQEIDDLKEIFTATHDLGVAWQDELVKLRAENETLTAKLDKLTEETDKLTEKIRKLSEDQIKNLRDEIIQELNSKNTEEFQKYVQDYLKEIRKCVDGKLPFEPSSETPKEPHIDSEDNTPEFNEHNESRETETSPKYDD